MDTHNELDSLLVDPEAAREAAEYSSSLDESPFGSSGGHLNTGSEEEEGHEAEAESDGDEEPEEAPEPPRPRVSQRRLQLQQKQQQQQRARQQEESEGRQDSAGGQEQMQQPAARVGRQESRRQLAQCAVQPVPVTVVQLQEQQASPLSIDLCAPAPQPIGPPRAALGAGGVFLARSLSHNAATCSSSDVQQLQLAGYPCSMQQQQQGQYARSYSTPLLAVAGYNGMPALQLQQQGTNASGSPASEHPSHPAGSSGGGAAGSGSGRRLGLVTYGSDAAAVADCCSGHLLQLCDPQQQHQEQQQAEYSMGSSRYGAYSGGRGNCTGSNGGSGDVVFGRRAAAVPVGTTGSLQQSPGCAVPQSAASPAPVPIPVPVPMPGSMVSRDAMDMGAGDDDQDPEWLVLMQSLETGAAGGDLAAADAEWDTPAQWADSATGGGGGDSVHIKQEEQHQQQHGVHGAGVAAVRSWLYDGDGVSVGVGAGASSSGMTTLSPFVGMEGGAVEGDCGALLSPWSSPPCAAAGQQQQALAFHQQNQQQLLQLQPQLLQLQPQGSGAAGSPLLTAMLPQTTSLSSSEVRHDWDVSEQSHGCTCSHAPLPCSVIAPMPHITVALQQREIHLGWPLPREGFAARSSTLSDPHETHVSPTGVTTFTPNPRPRVAACPPSASTPSWPRCLRASASAPSSPRLRTPTQPASLAAGPAAGWYPRSASSH